MLGTAVKYLTCLLDLFHKPKCEILQIISIGLIREPESNLSSSALQLRNVGSWRNRGKETV